MTRSPRRSSVSPTTRKEWLRRHEDLGESPPQIAKSDGWDVRTVRKQIDVARQEREAREARQLVLRHALEEHYADLCSFAKKLDEYLTRPFSRIGPVLADDRLARALRQHLPRSPIWKGFSQWDELVTRAESSAALMRNRIFEEGKRKLSAESCGPEDTGTDMSGFFASLPWYADSLGKGTAVPDLQDYTSEPLGDGRTRMNYGQFSWVVSNEAVPNVEEIHRALVEEMAGWPECQEWRDRRSRLGQLRDDLREELAVVIFRRVVPGRCVYCPV